MLEESNTVHYIADNNGTSGYISIQSVIPYNDKFYVIGDETFLNNPHVSNQKLFLITNENGTLKLDVSVLSEKAMNEIKSMDRNSKMDLDYISDSYNYFSECFEYLLKSSSMIDFDSFQNITEKYVVYEIELIKEYSILTTKKFLCNIFDIKFDDNVSSVVDDFLVDLFGPKVQIKPENKSDIIDDTKLNSNTSKLKSDYLNDVDAPKEKPNQNITELLESLSQQYGLDTKNINTSSEQFLLDPSSILLNKIQELIKVIYINNAEESLTCEQQFHDNLTYLLNIDTNMKSISPIVNDYINLFTNNFLDNKSLQSNLYKFYTELQNEIDYVSFVKQNTKPSDSIELYIMVKNHLFNEFKKHFVLYEMIIKNAFLSSFLVEKQIVTFFAILFQLTHLVNKTKLKNENDIKVKQDFLNSLNNLDHIKQINDNAIQHETNIVSISNKYLNEFRLFVDSINIRIKN